jgi:hypothetical protein
MPVAPAGSSHLTAKQLIGSAIFASLLLGGASAAAQQIQISQGDCATGIRLTAKNAPLSAVLTRLAQVLDFQLKFEGGSDPTINLDVERQAPELVAKLSPVDNVLITQALDPRCPRQYRIVKVWVLPGANQARTQAQTAGAPRTATTLDARRVDEMARLRKEMYDTYVRNYGHPPPTPEEEPAN